MAVFYQHELDFTLKLMERMRLPVRRVHQGDSLQGYDEGLRTLIGMEHDYENAYRIASHWSKERTIYKIMDQFMCRYIYFHLPGEEPPTAVVLGPYLTNDPAPEDVLELVERIGLPMAVLPRLSDYYASLPIFHDPSAMLAIVTTLGETMWDGQAFDMVDVNYDQQSSLPGGVSVSAPIEEENILLRMQQMEERYAHENELMEIVSKGLINQAEVMMSGISHLNYQPRVPDPLRNMKNYCIICNTILRKAAQQGGVHPIHLDRMSSQFARTIENAPSLEKCSSLIGEMLRAYCRLVRTHAGQQHSAIVQRTLTYITANLSGDLSLTTLARLMQITPSYLSTLFHRETGTTLADHIIDSRMKASLQLLKTTRLQVQSLAQLCGFSDPSYFSRQFRRFYGMTPMQYRREQIDNNAFRIENGVNA